MDMKQFLKGFGFIMFLIIIVRACNSCGSETKPATKALTREEIIAQKHQKLLVELVFVEAYYSDFKIGKYTGSVEGIVGVAKDFKDYRRLMLKLSKHDSVDVSSRANALLKKITELQVKSFPALRKAYVNESRNMLWRNNIDVDYDGKGILTYTGGFFASNANIEDTYLKLQPALELLRFKQANFRFTEYSDYTYYRVSSPKDSE